MAVPGLDRMDSDGMADIARSQGLEPSGRGEFIQAAIAWIWPLSHGFALAVARRNLTLVYLQRGVAPFPAHGSIKIISRPVASLPGAIKEALQGRFVFGS